MLKCTNLVTLLTACIPATAWDVADSLERLRTVHGAMELQDAARKPLQGLVSELFAALSDASVRGDSALVDSDTDKGSPLLGWGDTAYRAYRQGDGEYSRSYFGRNGTFRAVGGVRYDIRREGSATHPFRDGAGRTILPRYEVLLFRTAHRTMPA
jgi:hypothetical protein